MNETFKVICIDNSHSKLQLCHHYDALNHPTQDEYYWIMENPHCDEGGSYKNRFVLLQEWRNIQINKLI